MPVVELRRYQQVLERPPGHIEIAVDDDGPLLLGRIWLEQLKLNRHNIFHVGKVDTLSDVLDRHKMMLDKGLGTIKGFTAEIKLQDGAKLIFCKACLVP